MRVIGSVEHQTPKNSYVAMTNETTSPYISAYPFSTSGFGTKFSNPATALSTAGRGINFNRRGNYLAAGANLGGANINVYPWSTSGFGTAMGPYGPTTRSQSIMWSPDDNDVAVTNGSSSPYFVVYPWSASGFGTKYADPSTLPSADGSMIAWSNNKTAVFLALRLSPYLQAYSWSNGWGTRYTDPATVGTSSSFYYMPKYTDTRIFGDSGGTAHSFVWSDSTGFGTRSTLSISNLAQVNPSPSGNFIVTSLSASPYSSAYPFTTSFGTKYADPATLVTSASGTAGTPRVTFSQTETMIAMSLSGSPYIAAYNWSNGWGTKFSDPSSLPPNQGQSIAFLN